VIVDDTKSLGTQVIVSAIEKSHGALLADTAHSELAKIFAPYLSQYPNVSIFYDGAVVDPREHQVACTEMRLNPVLLPNGKSVDVVITIIEWNIETTREIHLCDANGVSLLET